MNDQTLDMIRRAIARGMDNDAIRDVLAVTDDTPIVQPVGRRVTLSGGVLLTSSQTATDGPAIAVAQSGKISFTKPDVTTKTYRLLAAGRKALAGGRFNGNMHACMSYLASQPNGEADTRAMRGAILTHKLSPITGRNAAIESALHKLKTDGYIASKPKPFIAPPTPFNAVPLDDNV